MKRSYTTFRQLDSPFTSTTQVSATINPETNPYSGTFSGIFGCNKLDLDFNTSKKALYIKNKTSYVGAASTTTVTINTPECGEGDLLLFFGVSDSGTWLSEDGWTLEDQSNLVPNMVLYSKTATGSEPSTYTFDITGNQRPNAAMISISNWTNLVVGSFSAQASSPSITVPSNSATKKIILVFIGNDGTGRSWDINGNDQEYQIYLLNSLNASLQLTGIYRASSNTNFTYTTTQTGAGSNSHGLAVVVTQS